MTRTRPERGSKVAASGFLPVATEAIGAPEIASTKVTVSVPPLVIKTSLPSFTTKAA